jgi:tight adherence protein B
MTTLLAGAIGAMLGVGVLLVCSARWWPAASRSRRLPSGVLRTRLAAAGLPTVPAPAFVATSILFAVAVGALVLALTGVLAFAAASTAAAAAVPWMLLAARIRRRRLATAVVWPDVADQLVSAIRAGLALPDAICALAGTGPSPTRAAFQQFAQQYRRTGNVGLALDDLKERLADPVADRLIETLRLARDVGGAELTSVLRALAHWLRQDHAARAEAAARRSWIVVAARLGLAAPWIVLALLSTRPEAAAAYNTPAGALVILGALGASVVGYRIMIAVGRLPEPRRWFA